MEGSFSYQADARPVQDRPRYREGMEPTKQLCNIAHDPRIYRGSTYQRRNALTEKVEKIPSYPRKVLSRDVAMTREGPPDGYRYGEAQTEEFKPEEIILVKQETDVEVQTDPYTEMKIVHRKPAPLVAVGTKTNTPGNELFNFDVEVQPFVQTLVQKALHDASMEVHEETELLNIARYLRAFEQSDKKEAEKIAMLEKMEADKFAEKERIVQERLKIEEAQLVVRAKVLARGFAEFFTWDLADDVMNRLKEQEYFYDESERAIDEQFMPWLFERAGEEFQKASVPMAYSKRATDTALQMVEDECKEIDSNADNEEKKADEERLQLLRRMIAERRVALAMRVKKQMKAKKAKKDGTEEEDKDDAEDKE